MLFAALATFGACGPASVGGMLPPRMVDGGSPLDLAMARFAAGDEGALATVYDLGSPPVFTFLLRLCGDRPLAEDLTQETFLRIHKARGLYREGAPVLPWAFTIARRIFLDHLRSHPGRAEVLSHAAEVDRPNQSPTGTPKPTAEDLLASAELTQAVDAALATLPEAQASAFRLIQGEGLSVAEAAAVMGTTKGAVKLRAHRAYLALRAMLGHRVERSGR